MASHAVTPQPTLTDDAPGTRVIQEYRIECREKETTRWRYIRFTGAGPYTDEARAWSEAERQSRAPSVRFDFRVTHRTKTVTTTEWEV
jgi:hypothetical protein